MRRAPLLLLLAALALATFFRLWRLEEVPPGLYHDEAYNGLDALTLLSGGRFPQFYEGWELYAQDAQAERPLPDTRFPIFFAGNYGREPLHVYFMALAIWLFGATPFAIRLVPALAGILGVFTTYLAAGALLRRRDDDEYRLPAAYAACFVAILFPAVHFSRFGLRTMLFLPVATLAVYMFWRGVAGAGQRQTFAFGTAGLFLGLGVYVYAAGRLFPLLFVLFVLIWLGRDSDARDRYWRPIALMAAVSTLTALPLLIFFARYPYFFTFRIAYVANRGLGAVPGKPWLTWLLNVGRVVRGFFWQGETHLRHNLPGRPFLDVIQALLLLIGLARVGRGRPDRRHQFLLLWLVIMLLPSVLSGDAPHFGRLTGAIPPVAILLALGLRAVSDRLAGRTPRRAAWPAFIALLVLAGSALITARDYFGRYAAHPQLATDFYLADWELGRYAAAESPETTLYLAPTQEELATIYFALGDPERLRDFNGRDGVLPAGQPDRPALYLLRAQETATLQALLGTLPGGTTLAAPGGATAYRLPAGAERLPVSHVVDVAWEGQIALRGWSADFQGDQLHVWLAWQALAAPLPDLTAFVHLLGPDGAIVVQRDRPPLGYPTSAWRAGEIVVDHLVVMRDREPAGGRDALVLQTGFYEPRSLTRLGEPAVLNPALIWPSAP